jgi:hypothetical protein
METEDIIVAFPKMPPMRACLNMDCDVLFYNGEKAVCPGCWDHSPFEVFDMKYSMRKLDQ